MKKILRQQRQVANNQATPEPQQHSHGCPPPGFLTQQTSGGECRRNPNSGTAHSPDITDAMAVSPSVTQAPSVSRSPDSALSPSIDPSRAPTSAPVSPLAMAVPSAPPSNSTMTSSLSGGSIDPVALATLFYSLGTMAQAPAPIAPVDPTSEMLLRLAMLSLKQHQEKQLQQALAQQQRAATDAAPATPRAVQVVPTIEARSPASPGRVTVPSSPTQSCVQQAWSLPSPLPPAFVGTAALPTLKAAEQAYSARRTTTATPSSTPSTTTYGMPVVIPVVDDPHSPLAAPVLRQRAGTVPGFDPQ